MTIELTDRAARPAPPRRGRHAMTGTVALLVLAVGLSDLSGVRRPAATPTAGVGTGAPSSTAPPPPAPAPSVPSPPRVTTSAVTPVGPPAALGRLFYVPSEQVAGRERVRLRSWRPGERPRTLTELPQVAALANASVSPDGRRIAWVDPGRAATLFVADVDGSRRRTLARHVDAYCVTPTWAPDSRRLLFREADPLGTPGRFGVLDTAGRRTRVTWWDAEPQGCHALWSADGRTVAMNSATGVTLYSADGHRPRPVPHLSGPSVWRSAHVASLSPDGSRIALTRTRPHEQTGDVGRLLTANAVLWTRDGREVSLPTGGRELRQVFFRPDGSAVVRVRAGAGHALLVVGRDGRKVSEVAEPAELRGMQIVSA
ncbi:TolB-like translocation protein [Micromonospora coxensis]|uniref:WD40-like Beta Propeller Repeat n=1 Tax=Micromonospora coxensis TaxID=356852 RepID=A0A1C5IRJ7_9ACTN|nr:PD40 domain-containing protein [Micromonospora coxensis]SCG60763.1 WD40-like Beta Propeller Repeat [Micromonospora coxensis]